MIVVVRGKKFRGRIPGDPLVFLALVFLALTRHPHLWQAHQR